MPNFEQMYIESTNVEPCNIACLAFKPQYRHQGIGLAMKIRAIAYAQSSGYVLIKAENDAKNKPMLAMNEKIGYVRKPALITFEKQWQLTEK